MGTNSKSAADLREWDAQQATALVPSSSKVVDLAGDWGDNRTQYSLGDLQTDERDRRVPALDAQATPDEVMASFSDQEVEAWDFRCRQELADHPDPQGFATRFDALPGSVRRKAIKVAITYPHLRKLDLFKKVAGQLTLEEAFWADQWAEQLPDVDRRWVHGDG